MENWKEFHNTGRWLWSVSDHGRIKKKCVTTKKHSKNFGVEKIVNTSLTGGQNATGRYQAIPGNYGGKYVHRIVATAFIPNPENKRTVNHIDCNKNNNHLSNLEWATYKENNVHGRANGLFPSQKLPAEELARRKAIQYQRRIKELRAERKVFMHNKWKPFLDFPITKLQKKYVRLRMQNVKPKYIAEELGIRLRDVYRLTGQIREKYSNIF